MIQTEWGNPQKTIVVCTFVDPWTWDEYYAMVKQSRQMYESIHHNADMILDFTRGRRLPNGALTHLRRAASQRRPRTGILIMVGVGPLIEAIIKILMKLYPKTANYVRQTKTREEAFAMLEQVRAA